MMDCGNIGISKIDKEHLINLLTEELPVLRAKIGLTQGDLSSIIGVSRQTYSAFETKKRIMHWNTFLSIVLFFDNNENTKSLLEASGVFPDELKQLLNIDKR